jgi:hypothetical protein
MKLRVFFSIFLILLAILSPRIDDNLSLGSVGIDCLWSLNNISWDSSYFETEWAGISLGSVFILVKGV